METIYKNCCLKATKEWMQGYYPKGEQAIFYGAYDLADGYEIVCSFSEYPTCRDAIRGMKETVDKYKSNPSGWRDDV